MTIAAPAHAGIFSKVIHALSNAPGIGGAVNHYANKRARAKVNDKIESLRKDALKCSPLEADGEITVVELVKMKPAIPSWKKLEKLEDVARKAKREAEEQSDNDKVRHCYAGCKVRKKLSFSSARLVAFLKEMKDVSDCKSSTHFEMEDYYATLAGATAGKVKSDGCREFCGASVNTNRTGSEMLAAARKYVRESKK